MPLTEIDLSKLNTCSAVLRGIRRGAYKVSSMSRAALISFGGDHSTPVEMKVAKLIVLKKAWNAEYSHWNKWKCIFVCRSRE